MGGKRGSAVARQKRASLSVDHHTAQGCQPGADSTQVTVMTTKLHKSIVQMHLIYLHALLEHSRLITCHAFRMDSRDVVCQQGHHSGVALRGQAQGCSLGWSHTSVHSVPASGPRRSRTRRRFIRSDILFRPVTVHMLSGRGDSLPRACSSLVCNEGPADPLCCRSASQNVRRSSAGTSDPL